MYLGHMGGGKTRRETVGFENARSPLGTNPRGAITVSSVGAGIVLVLITFFWFSNYSPKHHAEPLQPSSTSQSLPVRIGGGYPMGGYPASLRAHWSNG
jgi:hypothetical protein